MYLCKVYNTLKNVFAIAIKYFYIKESKFIFCSKTKDSVMQCLYFNQYLII